MSLPAIEEVSQAQLLVPPRSASAGTKTFHIQVTDATPPAFPIVESIVESIVELSDAYATDDEWCYGPCRQQFDHNKAMCDPQMSAALTRAGLVEAVGSLEAQHFDISETGSPFPDIPAFSIPGAQVACMVAAARTFPIQASDLKVAVGAD